MTVADSSRALTVLTRRRTDEAQPPYGTAVGVPGEGDPDLGAAGYVEEELVLAGHANLYDYDDAFGLIVARSNIEYVTRILVRRPASREAASGTVHLEPLHPTADGDPIWRAIHPYLLENGHTWVGVSHSRAVIDALRTAFDQERYGQLHLPFDGLGWDILGQVATLLRTPDGGAVTNRPVEALYMAGWSRTGTFCRTFLMDGFHERTRSDQGAAAIDGYLIGISSGAYTVGGYRPLRSGGRQLPARDPRRRVGDRYVPVIELMSELESETHAPVLREDGDSAEDPYRLYQVAGASHGPAQRSGVWPGDGHAAAVGLVDAIEIAESRSTFPLALIVRAAIEHLERWSAFGETPPHAARLRLGRRRRGADPLTGGEGFELERDPYGNAIGGVRSTWVDVPVASYYPHSRPAHSRPDGNADLLAYIRGHMVAFPRARLLAIYGSADRYLEATMVRAKELIGERWLRSADLDLVSSMAAAAAERFA